MARRSVEEGTKDFATDLPVRQPGFGAPIGPVSNLPLYRLNPNDHLWG